MKNISGEGNQKRGKIFWDLLGVHGIKKQINIMKVFETFAVKRSSIWFHCNDRYLPIWRGMHKEIRQHSMEWLWPNAQKKKNKWNTLWWPVWRTKRSEKLHLILVSLHLFSVLGLLVVVRNRLCVEGRCDWVLWKNDMGSGKLLFADSRNMGIERNVELKEAPVAPLPALNSWRSVLQEVAEEAGGVRQNQKGACHTCGQQLQKQALRMPPQHL